MYDIKPFLVPTEFRQIPSRRAKNLIFRTRVHSAGIIQHDFVTFKSILMSKKSEKFPTKIFGNFSIKKEYEKHAPLY